MTWTSQYATTAWVVPLASATAPATIDPATVQGAEGPLAPAGAVTLIFDCTRPSGSFLLRVADGARHSDRVLTVTPTP